MSAKFYVGDVFDVLATLADDSVDLIVTSPPFLALRSYLPADHPDKSRELGSEATPGAFIDRLLDVVEACARVLAPHGSLVFELGDTYAGGGGGPDPGKYAAKDDAIYEMNKQTKLMRANPGAWPLDKSKVLIPQAFALSLAYGRNVLRAPLSGRELIEVAERWAEDMPADVTARELLGMMREFLGKHEELGLGAREIEPWRVRNTVAWCRPNPPVGRDGDKFRPATSFLTIATKNRDRYWDGDAVRTAPGPEGGSATPGPRKITGARQDDGLPHMTNNHPAGAPLLDYWVIPTAPYKGSHYATYPPDLVVPLVKSMCPARVCRVCGKPSTRIVDAGLAWHREPREGRQPYEDASPMNGYKGRAARTTDTLGWSDCACTAIPAVVPRGATFDAIPAGDGGSKWRPGFVLDPFAGSGTTLSVATGHGFDCIGIDLDERNADLARERVGMFLEVDYGSPPAAEALTIEPRF